jgi:hypothetical protein
VGVVNLTVPNLTTPNLGGGPLEVEPEDIALPPSSFSRDNAHVRDALESAPSCLVAAAGEAGDASNRGPTLPLLVRVIGQRVQHSLGRHVLQDKVERPCERLHAHRATPVLRMAAQLMRTPLM